MTSPVTTNVKTAALIALALAIGAIGLYATNAVTAPLFAQPKEVPSVIGSAPSPQYAAAIERARERVRAGILEQNLPGVSVAVGIGVPSVASAKEGTIVWAEGFGWRDVPSRTPVTPTTRFNIGTAASAVRDNAVTRLGLTSTGAEPAAEWSPEHIGEPEEDFPLFTLIRHAITRARPLPGDRATFYVPRSADDPRRGRRLMYMRDLACCAGKMASYSTAPDMVRVGLATGGSINGELAGGTVMSLLTRRDSLRGEGGGIVVAVLANIAHADTAALSLKIADAFAPQR